MKKGFYFVPLVCSFLLGQAQSPAIESTLKAYGEQFQPEKVHIHFDKDAYLPGETIWLKAYIMEGSKPSSRSKNIYFDFSDANGTLLAHNISPVIESGASSSFPLPMNFEGGAIHVSCYTRWMMNFDSNFFYNKNIPVLSPWDGAGQSREKRQVSMQFFPEGGDLVTYLYSIVAFELTDQHGHPLTAKGVIKNSPGMIVDSFATKHDGMGSFSFRPLPNEKYTAYWKDDLGTHSKDLPLAQPMGLVLRLSRGPENSIHYQLERSGNTGDNLKSLTVICTQHQRFVSKASVGLRDNTVANGNISGDQLSTGVVQVTVFDANMVPVAERAIFSNNQKYGFTAQVRNEMINFGRKGKNEISVEIPEGFATELSVAVTDGGIVSDSSANIVSDFLLKGDIRGEIYNPAYYFNNTSDSARYYLDLVMRTHGWCRFKWEEVTAGKLPEINYPAETDYLTFKGQAGNGKINFDNSDSIALLVITKDKKKNLLSLPLKADGSFIQNGMFFYDSVQIVYKLNHPAKIGSGAEINMQTNLLPAGLAVVKAKDPAFAWSKVPDAIIEKEMDGLLAELKNYSRNGSNMDYVITPHAQVDSYKSTSETAAHYLETNFPFRFPYAPRETSATASFASQKNAVGQGNTNTPTKYNINLSLDGNPVTMDDLKQISMKEVLFIKIVDKPSPKDLQTLAITSRLAVYQDNIINNKTGFAVIRGYTTVKEFYVPQYAGALNDDHAEDFRSTLYWNPRVILDKDHRKIKLSFFNNDLSNKFRVIVEGMNAEGKLTRVEQIIK
jgi:hypothetical protein